MEKQTIKFDVPEITIRDVKGSIKAAQEKMQKSSDDFEKSMKVAAVKLKSDITNTSAGETVKYLTCQRDNLSAKKGALLGEVDKGISIVTASLEQARKVGATEIATAMTKQLAEMIASRSKAEQDITAGIAAFEDKVRDILVNGIAASSNDIKVEAGSL
jgi:hypothetical protein